MSPSMPTRLDRPTATGDPAVRAVLAVTAVVTVIGILALVRAAAGGGADHVTVRIDNQAGLAVQVDALDASGDRVGLGEAEPTTLTTFSQVPDVGSQWTLVAAYGGREVHGPVWPGQTWPPATGRSPSPPTRQALWSGQGSSDQVPIRGERLGARPPERRRGRDPR